MPSKTRSRWPPKTVPETCGETHALQLPRRQDRSTRPAKRLRLPGTLRRPGVEPLSPGGTRHPGRGNGPRAAQGPPGRLAGIPRTPARHPRLPAGRLSPLPGLAALHAANARVQVVGGVLCIAGLCGNPEAEQFSLEVAPDLCQRMPSAPGSALIRDDLQPALLTSPMRRYPWLGRSGAGTRAAICSAWPNTWTTWPTWGSTPSTSTRSSGRGRTTAITRTTTTRWTRCSAATRHSARCSMPRTPAAFA